MQQLQFPASIIANLLQCINFDTHTVRIQKLMINFVWCAVLYELASRSTNLMWYLHICKTNLMIAII